MNSTYKELISLKPEFFEVQVLACFIRSQGFYNTYGARINEYKEKLKGQHKFSNHRNNVLYDLIDAYRGSEAGEALGEENIPRQWLDDMISQTIESGNLTPGMLQGFPEFLDSVYIRATPEVLKSIQGDAFDAWFQVTLVEDFAKAQLSSKLVKDPEDVRRDWDDLMSLQSRSKAPVVKFADALLRDDDGIECISSDLGKLNTALGGGFRKGESTIFAATTGGGKTVMATQLANAFAYGGWHTLLVTTEQAPNELTPRMIANNLNIQFSEFQAPGEEKIVVPKHIMKIPRLMKEISQMTEMLTENLRFLDWSSGEGKSVEKHLDPELDLIMNDPKDPFDVDIVLFDWIGGALDRNSTRERREIYLDAANHLHDLAKRRNMCVIMFAQLNKSQAEGKNRCNSSMLAESKSMPDNATNAVYVSTMRPSDATDERSYNEVQYFNVDKARKGPGGKFPVKRDFQYQRFTSLVGASSTENENNTIQ